MDRYIDLLVSYGLERGLIAPADAVWCRNTLLDILQKPDYAPGQPLPAMPLPDILAALTDDAVGRGLCHRNTTANFAVKYSGIQLPGNFLR